MAVSIRINGIEVRAEPGMTVLEAARTADIYIPTLCYHPKLSPFGACRLCVVEIEDARGFPTACTVPVSDGMVIRTETEALQNLRREILSLILSEHPYTCVVCDRRRACDAFQGTVRKAAVTTGCQYCPQNGQCDLPRLVDYLNLQDIPYPITYRGLPVEQDDPFFDRDYNLCILCGRCVRVCQEVRHAGVLAFTYRGSRSLVGTAFSRSHLEADCRFCGACVDVCPTGALADKRGKWDGVPTAIVPSVCPYCSVGCALNVQVGNAKVIRAVGHESGPANDGQLCVRGRFGVVDVVHNPARLKSPLVRRDGRLVEVTWNEALDAVAQGLSPHRGDRFAAIASATATNEENYLLQKFVRTLMGSNNVALAAGFPEVHASRGGACTRELIDTLKEINTPAIRSVRSARCILAVGTNLSESHPILELEIRHALSQGARLITVDPRQTSLAKRSDVWLRPKVGTDHVLLAAMINAVAAMKEGSLLAYIDPDRMAEITGVQPEAVNAVARMFTEHLPSVVIYGSGVTHYPTASDTIQAISCLASLVGSVGVIGVPGEGNFVGAHDMGAHPARLPGYRHVSDPEARAFFNTVWGVSLNPAPGRSYETVLAGIRQGEIGALYLAGEVPPLPELSNLSFLVVQDILATEKTRYAHVVLPATTFAEMDGTLTNLEGRVQRLNQAIPPIGLARPGWMIIRDVAERMEAKSWGYSSVADVMVEISTVVPVYKDVNYQTLGVDGVMRRFEPVPKARVEYTSSDGVPRLTSPEFPFALITERNLFYYHGACLTEQVKGMKLIRQEDVLHLSRSDASQLGITNEALVKVVSPHGDAECMARVSNSLPDGTAFISVNRVVGSSLFPTLVPGIKACAVRIEASESTIGARRNA